MTFGIAVKRVDSVPEGACICHYDELDERAKERLPQLVREGIATTVDAEIAAKLTHYDVIKFTDYYRVVRIDTATEGTVSA